MYQGLKQGQITPNIENKYVLKFIHLEAQCSKIINTVLFQKRNITSILRFLLISVSSVRMSEGTFCRVEVQFYFRIAKVEAPTFVQFQHCAV